MVVVGDVIVTKIIEKLVEVGLDYAADRYFARDARMRVELGRLNDALPRIQAVVEMAESGQQEITGALKKWLWQLKDAVYEADDVLDELDYLKLQKQVQEKSSGSKEHAHSGGTNHITAFPPEVECRRFTSLRELELVGCGELASIGRLKALPHLYWLSIRECPKLVQAAAETTPASIKREEEQEFTSTVQELEIDDPFLLHIEPLRKLTSVRRLAIEDCSHLEAALTESWLLQNSTSLRRLELRGKAKCLPSSLQTLSSLEYLELVGVYELQSLPQLPLSLRTLMIRGCNEALKERCRENEGADWPNIRHIPRIFALVD